MTWKLLSLSFRAILICYLNKKEQSRSNNKTNKIYESPSRTNDKENHREEEKPENPQTAKSKVKKKAKNCLIKFCLSSFILT